MLLGNAVAVRQLARAEREVADLESTQFERSSVAAVQERKLAKLWKRAAETPYYGPLVHGSEPSLDGVAVTPKAAVRAAPDRFLTPRGRRPFRYYETSGTTAGGPLPVPRSVEDVVWNVVTLAFAWQRVVAREGPAVVLLPSDVAPIGDTVTAVCEYLGVTAVRCYPFAVGICDFDRAQAIFLRLRPRLVFAAPGLLLQFMRALKRRAAFGDVASSVARIMLLGEVATASLQGLLGREWGAEVFDASYGSTETGTIAAVCPQHRLHLLTHAFIAEVAGEDCGAASPAGRSGELVVTTLNGYARPLLRYAIGDTVSLDGPCPCGVRLPTVQVSGRSADTIVVGGTRLDVSAVESVVYGVRGITGYLIHLPECEGTAALVLERDVDCGRDDHELIGAVTAAFEASGVGFEEIRCVSQLPSISKSGAGQKSWKKTNVRVQL